MGKRRQYSERKNISLAIIVCTPIILPEKVTPLFPATPFSKLRSCQAPLFQNLVGGSTLPPPPPHPCRKGGGVRGCTLCLDPIISPRPCSEAFSFFALIIFFYFRSPVFFSKVFNGGFFVCSNTN